MPPKPKRGGKRATTPSTRLLTNYSLEESSKFEVFSKRTISEPRIFNMNEVEEDAKNPSNKSDIAVLTMANLFGCNKLASLHGPSYQELVVEFFTTFTKKDFGFSCRLTGKEILVDASLFSQVFGLEFGGEQVHLKANVGKHDFKKLWNEISKREANKDLKLAVGWDIEDDPTFYMFRFISHVILGKQEARKITGIEFSLLWCARNGIRPCIPSLIIASMQSQVDTPTKNFTYGPLITALAIHAGIDVRNLALTSIKTHKVVLIPRVPKELTLKKRKVSNALVLTEGPSHALPEDVPVVSDAPLNGWECVHEGLRKLQAANERKGEADKEFQTMVIARLDRMQEQQSHHEKECRLEFKSIKKFLMACMCMNKNAVVEEEDSGVVEQPGKVRSEEKGRGDEDLVCGVVSGGKMEDHIGDNRERAREVEEKEQGPELVDNSRELANFENHGFITEEKASEELNENDDLDEDDLIEAENTRSMIDHSTFDDDYIDASHPMIQDDEDPEDAYTLLDDDEDDDEDDE